MELDSEDIDKTTLLMKCLCEYRNQEFDEERFRTGIEHRLNSENDKIFVCKNLDDESIIGMVMADFNEETREGYIRSVIVDENYRGLHIGDNLMQKALEYFQEKEAENIKINVDEEETRAYKFYMKLGFIPELLPKDKKTQVMKIKLD